VRGRQLLEAHVRAFNEGVRSGDWEPMLRPFADDAELHFENLPAGPYVGRDEIRRGYEEQPPDDQIQLLGIQDDDEKGRVVAAFAWVRGGTGRLELEHEQGLVKRLLVVFDQ
jgi:hypothetical protein